MVLIECIMLNDKKDLIENDYENFKEELGGVAIRLGGLDEWLF
ncbi:hypothetical protein [Clostridium sp. Marseille-QA1073]